MKGYRCVNLISVIILGMTACATGGEAEQIVSKVGKTIREAKTLEIEFEERFIWKMTDEENVLKGTLMMSGDEKFRIETDDQLLVSDGETLWTYNKLANRVLIDQLANSDEALLPRQLLLQYTDGYLAQKLPSETVGGKVCDVLSFTDQDGESYYVKWQVWIDPDTYLPKKLMQEDLNGNMNIYILNSIRSGQTMDLDVFKFIIPEDAEVIEM